MLLTPPVIEIHDTCDSAVQLHAGSDGETVTLKSFDDASTACCAGVTVNRHAI